MAKQHTDEQGLGERFRQGDEDALNYFHGRYFKPLIVFARKFPGMSKQRDRSEAAGDVATVAFMNAWRYRATFKSEKKFFTWICGIAKNEWSSVRREWAKRCKEEQDSELKIIHPRLPPGVDPEIYDPLTYRADSKESKDHVDGLSWEKQADACIERLLSDAGDEFEEDDIPELTAEEFAEMEAKEDALQMRIKEALALGGVNAFLKLCEELFPGIMREQENGPYKRMIIKDMEEIDGELQNDLSIGIFPKHDINPAESHILTNEEIANNKKIFINTHKITFPHPSSLYNINLVYQKRATIKLSLKEVLILYLRSYPKSVIADKFDMSEGALKTAISRIRAKFPDSKQAVEAM